jgi:DNA-binding GntR family transcriptional regulator
MKALTKETTLGNLKRVSLVEQAIAAVKKAILNNTLAPGERIIEARLAATLHIGHPTVREALIQLEHEGFITRRPHRGTFVSESNPNQDAEVYRVREELELLAVRLARATIKDGEVASVQGHLEVMDQAARAFDSVAFVDADLAFHRAIWALSGNECLVNTLEQLTASFLVATAARMVQTAFADRLEVLESHRFYIRCLTAASDEEAAEIVRGTFAKFRSTYERALPKSEKDQVDRPIISGYGREAPSPHHLERHAQLRIREVTGPRELAR